VRAQNRAPHFDFADIVRQHRAELEQRARLRPRQKRALTDIAQCRTAALGGHIDACQRCGYEHPSYNSCRNRHCPKCQALAQEHWIAAQRARMLDAPHFHVVFTLPAQLRPLAAYAPREVYAALLTCTAATLRAFGDRRLSATLGATLVLHTWTRELELHPHVHAIVTAGGLAHDRTRWVPTRRRFLFPVKALSRVFRAKVRDALRQLYRRGTFADFDDFQDPQAFDVLLRKIAQLSWHVYAKPSFSRGEHVLQYLGRYTHRVGLANSRLLAVSDDTVTFRTRGSDSITLPSIELLRRFVQHVLPEGFHKIRHVGLYANKTLVARADELAGTRRLSPVLAHDLREKLLLLTGRDIGLCPHCAAPLTTLPLARAPPGAAA
jgi:hypothetical protein